MSREWDRLQFHLGTMERVIGFTRVADAKAAPILALQAALAVGAVGYAARIDQTIRTHGGGSEFLVWALMITYLVTAAASWWTGAQVYRPTHRPSKDETLIYFEDVRAYSKPQFIDAGRELSYEEAERQVLAQIHTVSGIAQTKMNRVARALNFAVVSLVSWVTLVVWVELHPPPGS